MKRTIVAVALAASLLLAAGQAAAQVVISQVYGGGGNSGATLKNDFVELFNRGTSAVDVTGWSVQYASSAGSSWQKTNISGTIQPGQYYLIQEAAGSGGTVSLPTPDATGSIAMSATAGKVALANTQTALTGSCPGAALGVVDFVGYGGANCFEGSGAAPTLSNTTAALRAGGGCTDTDDNASDFSAGAPTPRNSASPFNTCGGPPPPTDPSGLGAANPASLLAGGSTLLTVAVTPGANPTSTGIFVTADLSTIGGSATQWLYDDGTNGDATAGDDVFSFQETVGASVTPGSKSLPVTITDAQLRTGTTTISLTVEPPLTPIHDIQGAGDTSPLDTQFVATTGVVTGIRYNDGFFLQAPDAEADSDPATSEGIFVYTGGAPPATAVVGNELKVIGTVKEYVPSTDPYSLSLTEIVTPTLTLMTTGNPLPEPVTLTAADTNPGGGLDQLERFEGMRVHVDSLTVVAPTQGSVSESSGTATSNGVFYGVMPGIARPFLEPGVQVPDLLPAGAPCCVPRFDGNPERVRVNSYGLKGATRIEVTSGATVTSITGPLDYVYRSYTIDTDPGPAPTVSGNVVLTPVPDACPAELTVATVNVQRLGVTMQSVAGLAKRLGKLSLAIRNVMKFPDIIGIEEVEDLTTLQAISARVSADAIAAGQPNPQYAAYLEEGNDFSGINVGFLVKTPKVTVLDVTQVGKDETFFDPVDQDYKLLNDRPPLVMHAAIQAPGGTLFPVTVIVNHLRSLTDINADPGNGPFVRAKRAGQAEFLADLIQEYQAAGEQVISVGDYNATQFSDGYVDVIGTILGTPAPFDQVILATTAGLVTPTLADLLDLASAEQRYSYVYDGNAQEIDHILVTAGLLPSVNGLYYARDNADFPESYRNDSARPERYADHDPVVAYFELLPVIGNVSVTPAVLWPASHKMVTVTVNYDLETACSSNPVMAALSVASDEPVNGTGDGDTAPDWIVVDAHHVQLRAERAGTGDGRTYTITITATDSRGKVTTQDVTVTVPHNK